MIIKSVSASAFGRLKEWACPNFSSTLTVVYGHNETGKSTLFNLIVTLLYGWQPVKHNEYIPWEGTAPLIKGVISTSDGQELEVNRRLRSQPEGNLIMGERNIALRNDAIPQVAFMSREVFREIYALNLNQLRFPDSTAWQKLQDQLLGGQYGSFLRPVSAVLNELENEAGGLWRSDRRGNPRSKVLDREIKELRQKIREAEENERELRCLEAEQDQLIARQKQLKEGKIRLTTRLRRYSLLIPLSRQLHRLQELKTDAGNISRFDSIPEQPNQEKNRLQAGIQELEGKEHALSKKIDQSKDLEGAFSESDQEIISLGEVIRPLVRRSGHLQSYIEQQQELQQKLSVNNQRLQDRASQFLKGGWRLELSEMVKAVDEVELKGTIDAFSSSSQKRNEVAAQLEGLKTATGTGKGLRLSKKAPLVALLMLLTGISGSLFGEISPLGIGSAVLGAAGLIILALWYLSGARDQEDTTTARVQEMGERLADMEGKCCSAQQHVREALQCLPVAEQRLDAPDVSLLMDVKDLKNLLWNREDLLQGVETAKQNLAEATTTMQEPARICGLELGLSLPKSIELLDQRLAAAEERRKQAVAAEKVRTETSAELEELNNKLKSTQENLEQLQENVDGLLGESWQEKVEVLIYRRRVRQQVETMENELQRQYPDFQQLVKEIEKAEAAGESWICSDEAEARAQLELDETGEALNQASGRIGTIQSELSSRQQQERLDDLQGQLSCLQEELAEAARERDRLVLLHNLLAAADRNFREEHQPDVLQKAGRYLATITGNRYTRMSVKEDGSGLELQSNYYDYPLEVGPPLSRGTLEQIYLALRLALVEHLDAGGERLPLFLDEALVNWDGVRLEKGLQLLEELSATRQVFLFTCHTWLVEALQGSAEIITL